MNDRIIICTGGTGGHVIPAVNFGNFLIEKGYNCILMVDQRGKIFSNSFKGKIYIINSAHLSGNLLFKIKSILKLTLGFVESLFIIAKFKPKKFISFGSYATLMPLSVVIILKLLFKINIYIHEQNSVIGKVNSLFLQFTEVFFTNFNLTKKINKKYENKIFNVGLPSNNINYQIISKPLAHIKETVIFVYGGSQGSTPLINNVLLMLRKINLESTNKIYLYVQAQKKIHHKLHEVLKNLNLAYELKDFYNNIDEILSLTNLAITRAGAGTINDIIRHNIPSILIPLPHSINNHQYYNAKSLSDLMAAIIFDENDFDITKNSDILVDLINNHNERDAMRNRLSKINIPNANEKMLSAIRK